MKNTKTYSKFTKILGIKVNSNQKNELLEEISLKLKSKSKFTIFTPNPEIILEACNDLKLKEILNKSDFNLPDGNGLKIADPKLEIIKGREFMLDLFKLGNDKKLKIYLLGSTKDVNTKSLNKIKKEFPNIKAKGESNISVTKGNINLPFDILKNINLFKPDILFVALGAPKQEYLINKYRNEINAKCFMAIGGSLDYFSGQVRQVPDFFTKFSLEWLWRLIQEPKRAGRIFNAVIVFPLKVILSDS
ncbi:MAG TPA: WecB/TagA/CpsF family glycosyltransferase [Patescibacteria group bacterium]|nr:WecB/TagA/CpsF family glycosyltransferase [Patescibacteria group bacterium]